MTVGISGHRDIPLDKYKDLENTIKEVFEKLISEGADAFYCGGAIGFDMMAEEVLLELKKIYPQVKLYIIQYHRGYDRGWDECQKERMQKILSSCDGVEYMFENYFRGAPLARNRKIVDSSDVLVAYLRQNNGGTYSTVQYARKNGKKIVLV